MKKNRFTYSMVAIFVVLIALCYLSYSGLLDQTKPKALKEIENADVTVHFIDVGQGDCTLIKAFDKVILVDAGEYDQGTEVCRYLKSKNIEKIDLVIASHYHSDHIGGLITVLDSFEIEEIILPVVKDEVIPTSKVYRDFIGVIEKRQITPVKAEKGLVREFGGAKLTVIEQYSDYDDLNDTSVIAKFEYGEASLFLAGDIEKKVENRLLKENHDLKVTVAKINHHGSNTSSTLPFLTAVGARFYVISCGVDNSHNHPNPKTIERLESIKAEYYRTDLNGSVIFSFNNDVVEVYVSK